MRVYNLVVATIIFVAGSAWVAMNFGESEIHKTPAGSNKNTYQEYIDLGHKMDLIASELGNINLLLTQLAQTMAESMGKQAVPKVVTPQQGFSMDNAPIRSSPSIDKSTVTRPQVLFVNPSQKQNEDYDVLNAHLDDQSFLSGLNLREFSQSIVLQSLPESLQMVLIQKAISQYNSGNISPETFLGPDAPIYR